MNITELPKIPGLECVNALPMGARVASCEYYAEDILALQIFCEQLRNPQDYLLYPAVGWPVHLYRKP